MIYLRRWIPTTQLGVLIISKGRFFTEFERFDNTFTNCAARAGIDYVSASPNYLHDSHMRFALRSGADAVAKASGVNPWNIDL